MTNTSADDIRTYRLDPGVFESLTKRRFFKRVPWIVLAVAAGLTLQFGLMARATEEGSMDMLPIILPVVAAIVGFSLFRSVRAQLARGRPAWESYRLTISENVLRRVIVDQPAVEVLRSEVTAIVSAPDGLRVTTQDRHRFIFVPAQLIGFSELCQRLSGWQALEAPKLARNRALTAAWTALLLGSWLGTGLIPDLRWAMVAGVVLLAVASFSIRETLKLQVVDNKYKATAIRGLCFLMLAPFARLLLHFAFHVDLPWSR
ncbi:MAG TPA: hypothetical protein VGC79_35930 [Polyangiaceae bacterium]